ncbi:fumarylacetoacetate hydrolase family protein [Rhodococcus sp. ARC_M6]|uniref:fumarylacetoacetate hydrolase family protein n=1 Tax=Rhodococcus sp. ARC_M6 TaxID=2928852 RepID=UPI0035AF2CE1
MISSAEEQISILSQNLGLDSGNVVLTRTPAGVGVSKRDLLLNFGGSIRGNGWISDVD